MFSNSLKRPKNKIYICIVMYIELYYEHKSLLVQKLKVPINGKIDGASICFKLCEKNKQI